jgi:hypothetical protein
MKMQRIPSVALCILLLWPASGCVRPRVYFDVPTSSSPAIEGYGKEGTTIQWRAFNRTDSFTVKFTGAPPCKSPDPKKLHATYDHPAECELHLVKGHPDRILRFTYTIRHDNRGIDDGPYGQHVGSCGSCAADFGRGEVGTGTTASSTTTSTSHTTTTSTPLPTYFQESISCEPSPSVNADPVKPSIGDTVQWFSPSGQSWKITFTPTPSVCPSPMTQDKGKDTCTVAGTSGQPYPYTVDVAPKGSHPGCTIAATLNVQ